MRADQIQIRDPFIFANEREKTYYLFGTTDKNCWYGQGEGFDCYKSIDLQEWQGPFPAFYPPQGFWGTTNFWAPEVHCFKGRYYMFASFKADRRYRGTQILTAEHVGGPYLPLSNGPVTPANWECLDGTLHVDKEENPWIVFCHEWVQVHNGAMYAMRLTSDLQHANGKPVFLFNASEAPWVRKPDWPEKESQHQFPTFITDGPFLYKTKSDRLLMLWSSVGAQGYAMGIAESETDTIIGPWRQMETPLWAKDGGHGMIFKGFDDRLYVTFHMPNKTPDERPFFIEIEENDDRLRIKSNHGIDSTSKK